MIKLFLEAREKAPRGSLWFQLVAAGILSELALVVMRLKATCGDYLKALKKVVMFMFKAIASNSNVHVDYYILDLFTWCDSFHHTNNCISFGQGWKICLLDFNPPKACSSRCQGLSIVLFQAVQSSEPSLYNFCMADTQMLICWFFYFSVGMCWQWDHRFATKMMVEALNDSW